MRWVSGNVYDDGHCESPAYIAMTIGKETVSAVFAGHLCGAAGKSSAYTLAPFQSVALPALAAAAKTLVYSCDDGRIVQAVYPDTHTAVLTLDQQTHRLEIAISADGARYVGDHWQWWTKGMHQAWLTALKPGEEYASGNGADCHAP
jgi:membrane-bound inhibitor of C-type lysozyme